MAHTIGFIEKVSNSLLLTFSFLIKNKLTFDRN
nr:MAG TPA: hypothetical protein [Caudoviricetes sp.]